MSAPNPLSDPSYTDSTITATNATTPTTPTVISNNQDVAGHIQVMEGGVPTITGFMSGVVQDAKGAIGGHFYRFRPLIPINPDTAAGEVIFAFNYSQVLNPYMKFWQSIHQMYGGSILIRIRLISAVTYIGELYMGFYYGAKATTDITIEDLLQYGGVSVGMTNMQQFDFEFQPINSRQYYFDVHTADGTNLPSKDVRLVCILGTPLKNTYPTDTIQVNLECLSRPGSWKAWRFTLPKEPALKLQNSSSRSITQFEGKTLRQLMHQIGLPDSFNCIAVDGNMRSLNDQVDVKTGGRYHMKNDDINGNPTLDFLSFWQHSMRKIGSTAINVTFGKIGEAAGFAPTICMTTGSLPVDLVDMLEKYWTGHEEDVGQRPSWEGYNPDNCVIFNVPATSFNLKIGTPVGSTKPYVGTTKIEFIKLILFTSHKASGLAFVCQFTVVGIDGDWEKVKEHDMHFEVLNKDSLICVKNMSPCRPLTGDYKIINFCDYPVTFPVQINVNQNILYDTIYNTKMQTAFSAVAGDAPFVDFQLLDRETGLVPLEIRYSVKDKDFLIRTDQLHTTYVDCGDLVVKNISANQLATGLGRSKIRGPDRVLPRLEAQMLAGLAGGAAQGLGGFLSQLANQIWQSGEHDKDLAMSRMQLGFQQDRLRQQMELGWGQLENSLKLQSNNLSWQGEQNFLERNLKRNLQARGFEHDKDMFNLRMGMYGAQNSTGSFRPKPPDYTPVDSKGRGYSPPPSDNNTEGSDSISMISSVPDPIKDDDDAVSEVDSMISQTSTATAASANNIELQEFGRNKLRTPNNQIAETKL